MVVTVFVEVVRGKNIRGFRTLEGVNDNDDVLNSEGVERSGGDGDQLT